MEQRLPSKQDIEELVQYLPKLYKDGFVPIKRWSDDPFPYPEYEKCVKNFIDNASKECWCDYEYSPEEIT